MSFILIQYVNFGKKFCSLSIILSFKNVFYIFYTKKVCIKTAYMKHICGHICINVGMKIFYDSLYDLDLIFIHFCFITSSSNTFLQQHSPFVVRPFQHILYITMVIFFLLIQQVNYQMTWLTFEILSLVLHFLDVDL